MYIGYVKLGKDVFELHMDTSDDSFRVFEDGSSCERMRITRDLTVHADGKYIGRIRYLTTHLEFQTPFGIVPINGTRSTLVDFEAEIVKWYFTKMNEPSAGLFHELFKSPPNRVV